MRRSGGGAVVGQHGCESCCGKRVWWCLTGHEYSLPPACPSSLAPSPTFGPMAPYCLPGSAFLARPLHVGTPGVRKPWMPWCSSLTRKRHWQRYLFSFDLRSVALTKLIDLAGWTHGFTVQGVAASKESEGIPKGVVDQLSVVWDVSWSSVSVSTIEWHKISELCD